MSAFTHPDTLSVNSWRARKASLMSHGVGEDDHRVVECTNALGYLRFKDQLERGIADGIVGTTLRDAALASVLAEMHSKRQAALLRVAGGGS
jgi:hypothetical protein